MFRYTDGITEATDTDENMSREERMHCRGMILQKKCHLSGLIV